MHHLLFPSNILWFTSILSEKVHSVLPNFADHDHFTTSLRSWDFSSMYYVKTLSSHKVIPLFLVGKSHICKNIGQKTNLCILEKIKLKVVGRFLECDWESPMGWLSVLLWWIGVGQVSTIACCKMLATMTTSDISNPIPPTSNVSQFRFLQSLFKITISFHIIKKCRGTRLFNDSAFASNIHRLHSFHTN